MKLIQNKVYLTFQEMLECGFSDNTLKDAKKKGARCWDFIDDPADLRKVLVGYDGLKLDYKSKVKERFGNVYEQVARQPILDMVRGSAQALAFFKEYRYGAGLYLPIGTVNKYVRVAAWLTMLGELDKQVVKKVMGLSVAEFYIHVGELVGLEKGRGKVESYTGPDVLPGDFPGTYVRLMARVKEYGDVRKSRGDDAAYAMIIDTRYGNKNAAKLGKVSAGIGGLELGIGSGVLPSAEVVRGVIYGGNGGENDLKCVSKGGAFDPGQHERQVAVIRYCAALHNNLNAEQVRKMANIVFAQNGWKTVSVGTVRNFIRENKHVLTPGRKGKRTYMNKVAMQNKRKAPKWPMVYWTLDGWTVELAYNERGPKGMEYAKRLVVVVVLDAFNKYPIGYAIGERETPELIKEACRNAIMHTQELFGTPYQPLQVQSDNYQIKNLTPFYQAVKGRYFTPAAVGNSKAKVIEPYFGYLNEAYCQAHYDNWTGFNVDANRDNQVNREVLDIIKSQFPDKAGVVKQIQDIISQERRKKVVEYMAKWAELPTADKVALGTEDYLMLFGEYLNGRTNKIAGQGIVKQVDNEEYTFDSFDPAFRQNLHIDWQIIGDKNDLRQVLAVSKDGKMRFLLEQKRELPMDLYSTTQEDVDYRVRVRDFNNERVKEVTALYARDADMVREVISGSSSGSIEYSEADGKALQLMLTVRGQQKELLQNAKGLGRVQDESRKAKKQEELAVVTDWARQQDAYMNSKGDMSGWE